MTWCSPTVTYNDSHLSVTEKTVLTTKCAATNDIGYGLNLESLTKIDSSMDLSVDTSLQGGPS